MPRSTDPAATLGARWAWFRLARKNVSVSSIPSHFTSPILGDRALAAHQQISLKFVKAGQHFRVDREHRQRMHRHPVRVGVYDAGDFPPWVVVLPAIQASARR